MEFGTGRPQPALQPSSPAAERNKQPILDELVGLLPDTGRVLEIGSGTGQHVAFFAAALPRLIWLPSERERDMLEAIRDRIAAAGLANVEEPRHLDVTEVPWPVERADALFCANVIHIAPWAVTTALFDGARRVLTAGDLLILYGPFRRSGRHTAPSNASFDRGLRERNPEWGVRDLEDVTSVAQRHGFELDTTISMPANNLIVAYRRKA